jgi:hypothetical protein
MASMWLVRLKLRATQMPAHWRMDSLNIEAGCADILMAAKQLV